MDRIHVRHFIYIEIFFTHLLVLSTEFIRDNWMNGSRTDVGLNDRMCVCTLRFAQNVFTILRKINQYFSTLHFQATFSTIVYLFRMSKFANICMFIHSGGFRFHVRIHAYGTVSRFMCQQILTSIVLYAVAVFFFTLWFDWTIL